MHSSGRLAGVFITEPCTENDRKKKWKAGRLREKVRSRCSEKDLFRLTFSHVETGKNQLAFSKGLCRLAAQLDVRKLADPTLGVGKVRSPQPIPGLATRYGYEDRRC
jgi:hypothetical protein